MKEFVPLDLNQNQVKHLRLLHDPISFICHHCDDLQQTFLIEYSPIEAQSSAIGTSEVGALNQSK